MDKAKILSAIIDEQEKVINNLKASIERYKQESNMDEDNTLDPDDYARQNEAKDMQLRYENMLKSAKHNLKFLEDSKTKINDKIEAGTVIETDRTYIFVGVSVPIFKYAEKDVISVSEDAPIFKTLKAKKTGENLEFGKNSFKILKIN